MKTLLITLLLATTIFASAKAFWTGKSYYGTSVTGKSIVTCQYEYAGKKFWMSFAQGSCPSSVEVE